MSPLMLLYSVRTFPKSMTEATPPRNDGSAPPQKVREPTPCMISHGLLHRERRRGQWVSWLTSRVFQTTRTARLPSVASCVTGAYQAKAKNGCTRWNRRPPMRRGPAHNVDRLEGVAQAGP